MSKAPVAVTGIGLVTPAGIGAEQSWRAVLDGTATAAPDPQLAGLPVDLSCRVTGYDPRIHVGGRQPWRLDRYSQFAVTASREAVADANLSPGSWDGARVAVVLGSAAGGVASYENAVSTVRDKGPAAVSALTMPAFLPNMACGQLAIDLGARGPALSTATACASGATAILTAAMLLQAGACDVAVAGGSDSMVTPVCVAAFAQIKALSRNRDPGSASRPFDAARDGFVIGEGAGFLILERQADAVSRGARVRALLAGYGSAADAYQPVAPHPEARGLRDALVQALDSAGASFADVDHVNAHGTSTLLNDRAEALMLARTFTSRPPSVTSVKGVLGHTMGAAGAIEAALTVLSVQHQVVPPTGGFAAPDPDTARIDLVVGSARQQRLNLALSCSAGFGGHNAVLAFAAVLSPLGTARSQSAARRPG